jgi:hypothetical protein
VTGRCDVSGRTSGEGARGAGRGQVCVVSKDDRGRFSLLAQRCVGRSDRRARASYPSIAALDLTTSTGRAMAGMVAVFADLESVPKQKYLMADDLWLIGRGGVPTDLWGILVVSLTSDINHQS